MEPGRGHDDGAGEDAARDDATRGDASRGDSVRDGAGAEARLARDTADDLLSVLSAFERVVRWGFRAHRLPDDPGPGAQAALFFLLRHQPARAKDVADWLGVGAAPMSRQLADLEAQGLLVRTPDPDDARAARISLTDSGRRTVRELLSRRVAVLQQALGGLSDDEARRFIHTMEHLTEEFRRGLVSMGPATGTLAQVPQAARDTVAGHPDGLAGADAPEGPGSGDRR